MNPEQEKICDELVSFFIIPDNEAQKNIELLRDCVERILAASIPEEGREVRLPDAGAVEDMIADALDRSTESKTQYRWLANTILARVRELNPTPQASTPEHCWECTECGKVPVPGSQVTFEEFHDGCGGKCIVHEPKKASTPPASTVEECTDGFHRYWVRMSDYGGGEWTLFIGEYPFGTSRKFLELGYAVDGDVDAMPSLKPTLDEARAQLWKDSIEFIRRLTASSRPGRRVTDEEAFIVGEEAFGKSEPQDGTWKALHLAILAVRDKCEGRKG